MQLTNDLQINWTHLLLSNITLLGACVFCPHRKVRTCSEGSCFQVMSDQNNVALSVYVLCI